jgi:hypothetical protein
MFLFCFCFLFLEEVTCFPKKEVSVSLSVPFWGGRALERFF